MCETKINKIMDYLIQTYDPDGIITYGSFADGSNNEGSDFDALVLTEQEGPRHDAAVIDGTILDVFLYAPDIFKEEYNWQDFVQIYDGKILLDKSGTAQKLKDRVRAGIHGLPEKSKAEINQEVEWCEKMLHRTLRQDTEGYYRWHWLLIDSLEIYFDICGLHYFGPKKSLKIMKREDEKGYELYSRALSDLNYESLRGWINYLREKLF